jgi:LmbE family N-acetylglucosaminyl deacetylase
LNGRGTKMSDKRDTAKDVKQAETERGFKRVMIVTAHPDDPEFIFGATIAKLVGDGAEVCYLICSDGSNGNRDAALTAEEVSAIRYAEQRAAASALGVGQVLFLGLPDGQLAPTYELRLAIAREIRRVRPELVLTHFPRRVLDIPMEASHPDHTAVGEATLSAILPDATNARTLPELLQDGFAPHRVKEAWMPGYEQPNFYIDATPYLEKKAQAILCHKSQMDSAKPKVVPAWVYDFMRWSGSKYGCEYAEEFKRIRI